MYNARVSREDKDRWRRFFLRSLNTSKTQINAKGSDYIESREFSGSFGFPFKEVFFRSNPVGGLQIQCRAFRSRTNVWGTLHRYYMMLLHKTSERHGNSKQLIRV